MQTNRESNYDKYPATRLDATLWKGWAAIRDEISRKIQSLHRERCVVAIECYQGVYHEELEPELKALEPTRWVNNAELFQPAQEGGRMT